MSPPDFGFPDAVTRVIEDMAGSPWRSVGEKLVILRQFGFDVADPDDHQLWFGDGSTPRRAPEGFRLP